MQKELSKVSIVTRIFNKMLIRAQKYIKYKYLVLLFIPAILYYGIFHYGPMYGLVIAFKDYTFIKGIKGSPWIGFENFRLVLTAKSFKEVFGNTLIISGYKLLLSFPMTIIFALLLNEIKALKFKKIVQTLSYLPHFLSWVILAGVFTQILSPSTGPINAIIKMLGFKPIYFIADSHWFRTVLVLTAIWKNIGWGSIIYLASLSSINPEEYESADIDGANRAQKMIHITIPGLMPAITIMFILSVGRIINDDFDQVFNLYSPAVYKVGDVLSTYVYRVGLVDMKYSFATAVGLFKNVIAFILVIIANTVTKKINEYGIW